MRLSALLTAAAVIDKCRDALASGGRIETYSERPEARGQRSAAKLRARGKPFRASRSSRVAIRPTFATRSHPRTLYASESRTAHSTHGVRQSTVTSRIK